MTLFGQSIYKNSSWVRAGPRTVAAGAALLSLHGCDGAPSRGILGSYFPSWMVCALIGIAVAMIIRSILKASGILAEIPVPLVAILSTACAVTFAVWLLWLA